MNQEQSQTKSQPKPTIDQIKTEQSIFTDTWNLYKTFCQIETDQEWEQFLSVIDKLLAEKYKGTSFEKMYREMALTITNQIERNFRERNFKKRKELNK